MNILKNLSHILFFSFLLSFAETGEDVSKVGTLSSMPPTTTIITHGFNLDVGTPEWKDYKWQFSMADKVSDDRQILFIRKGEIYQTDLNYFAFSLIDDKTKIDDLISSDNIRYFYKPINLSKTQNVVIVFDWIEESDKNSFGWSEAAGDALAASLMRLAENYPWILKKLHFIGHSRGTVVNSEAIQRLIYYASQGYLNNIEMDKNIHMTTLDPHPAGHWLYAPQRDDAVNSKELAIGVSGWIGGEYSTAYIDNYYQTEATFEGLPDYPGLFYKKDLTSLFPSSGMDGHILVHTWYHGTVDTQAEKDEFGNGRAIENNWYNQRNNEGFAYSFMRKNDLSAIASNQNTLTSVHDFGHFNDGKLIFNGDFLINSFGSEHYTPGWNYQGGSGGASVYLTHLDLKRTTPEKTHNFFYIARDKIYFSASVTKKSQDDELYVLLLDENNNSIIEHNIPLSWYTSFKNYSMDVSKYRGTVKRLKFEIVNKGFFIDSEVLVDNIGFEKYDNMEAVIALNVNNSSGNSLKKVSTVTNVYLHVYDNNGNHTGQVNDTTWVTEIPGSYYYVSPDSVEKPFKAVYLPKPENGQEYTFMFESKGTTGNVDFSINDFSNGENAQTVSFDSIQISENTSAETIISQVDSNTTLQLDSDGDGNADTILLSSSYLVNYKIFAHAGVGGSITPSDTLIILNNDSVTYSIKPDSGYIISDVMIDSVSKGPLALYSFNNISKNHSIYAEFKLFTGLGTGDNSPTGYFLNQNYPNPFNPSTQITFGIAKSSFVTIEIYNLLGQRVQILINKKMNAGKHTVKFESNNLSSGVYFYRISAGKFVQFKKMLLLR